MTTTTSRPVQAQAPASTGRRSWMGYALMPVLLGVVLLVLYLYVSHRQLDSIEARALTADKIRGDTWRMVELTAVSTFFVILVAVPLGILLTRRFTRRVRPYLLAVLNLGQAVPTIGIFVLLAVTIFLLGFWAAILGLTIYTIIPVLVNTIVGIEQVDAAVLEAGQGMGISKLGVLRQIELPLAVPIMLAGVRTALVINVGTATLATYINAGGYGDIIVAGLSTSRTVVTVTGAVLTAVLALLVDYLAGVAEDLLRPKGL